MSRKKWETLLNEATSLIKQSRESIYDAVTRMVQVSKDEGFLDFHGGDMDKAVGVLDELLAGFSLTFCEVELMLHYFPAREQWKSSALINLLAESIVKRDTERKKDSPPRVQNRASVKDLQRVTKELSDEREKSVQLAGEVSRQVSELDQLRARIRDLEAENNRLQGRIEELERLLNRDAASV